MSFSDQIKAFAAQAGKSVEETQRAVTLEVFGSVIEGTRVRTGRARGNWQTTVTAPATGTLDDTDASGEKTKAAALAAFKPNSLMIISNNLPYIGKLEELDGMVGLSISRIETVLRKVKTK